MIDDAIGIAARQNLTTTGPRHHPLTFWAFALTFFLVAPVQLQLVGFAVMHDLPVEAFVVFVGTSLLMIAPLLYAERQIRRHPERFKPRLLSKVTWTIIGLSEAIRAFHRYS
jgi:hypothetical protein